MKECIHKILDEKIRHKLAWFDERGQKYKDMLKKCPMKDCNGKPHPDRMRRIFTCDKCENHYILSYIPYLRRLRLQ